MREIERSREQNVERKRARDGDKDALSLPADQGALTARRCDVFITMATGHRNQSS